MEYLCLREPVLVVRVIIYMMTVEEGNLQNNNSLS